MRAAVLVLTACGRIGFDAGGASHAGDVLFVEHFDDASFAARGWYDTPAGAISTAEHAPGSIASFECTFASGATDCTAGRPGRVAIAAQDALYFSYWVQREPGFGDDVGIAYWISDADDPFVGPFSSHLTVVYNIDGTGAASVLTTDELNVDAACVQLDTGAVIGCNGNFATYPFGEARAVSGCNGVPADITGWLCRPDTGNSYVNTITRASPPVVPDDGAWHFVEGLVAMNSIADGVARADGSLRTWIDGTLAVAADDVLLRTGARPTLRFAQLFLTAYIGDGASAARTLRLDELTVAVGVP